jgi:anti-sigma B factor antagonist
MFNQRRPDPAPGGDDVTDTSSSPQAFPPFSAHLRESGSTAVLRLSGEVDLAVEDAMRDALDSLLESEARTLVIDLGELDYMDSTGVQRLLAAQVGADERGRRPEVRLGAAARRIVLLCGVLDRFTVVRD